ncbi:adenosine deaminase [bacterium]|nr:adenosine deaminase [bacterium]
MAKEFPEQRIASMPKAELHVHLEGSVLPETLLALAERHNVEPPGATPEEIAAWYSFEDFPSFLKRYFFVCHLLRTPEDFQRTATDYLLAAHRQGAVHVEFHVSASYHIVESGASWPSILEGIIAGCEGAERECGISSLLIPDLSPHLGAAQCEAVVDEILANRHPRITALGMGGPSDNWFIDDFGALMRKAHDAGLHVVSHAGEHGPSMEVGHAINVFGAERIQHGIAAVDDEEVLRLLRERRIPCDVCPGSNVALNAVPRLEDHPLRAMLDAGLIVTLGSDDPPMFQTSLMNEYRLAWQLGVTEEELGVLGRNSLEHSFATEDQKARWLADWEKWLTAS